MKINTQNYEAYLLDFIEGNLNAADEIEFAEFVRLNPNLKIDLENLNDFKLVPPQVRFNNKEILKENSEKAISGISKIERLSIAFLEAELNTQELNELNQLIENQKYNNIFENIQKTKLSVPKLPYKNKLQLKQKIQTRTFIRKTTLLYRVAALLILFLSFTFWFYQNKPVKVHNIALLEIKKIPSREIYSYEKDNANIGLSDSKREHTFKEITSHVQAVDEKEVAEKLFFVVPKQTELLLTENQQAIEFRFIQNNHELQKATYYEEKEKINFTHKAVWTVKKAGKTIFYDIAFSLRKNIRYKKQYLDNGKVLIALKAGDFEYKKIKEVKSP